MRCLSESARNLSHFYSVSGRNNMYDYDYKTNSSKDMGFNAISKEIKLFQYCATEGRCITTTVLATVLGYSSYDISRLKPFLTSILQ